MKADFPFKVLLCRMETAYAYFLPLYLLLVLKTSVKQYSFSLRLSFWKWILCRKP